MMNHSTRYDMPHKLARTPHNENLAVGSENDQLARTLHKGTSYHTLDKTNIEHEHSYSHNEMTY